MAVTPYGLFELIERGCDDSPDRLAFTFGERSWTWSELRRRILCLAVALRGRVLARVTGSPFSTRTIQHAWRPRSPPR